MLLTQLLYCSEHRDNLRDRVLVEQINNIVSISQRNNFKQSIMGVLFADLSSFVQILEGNRETIVELFGTIKQDRRHFNVLLLSVQDISERRYGAWPMGFLQKTPSNAHLFAPYIMGREFRPDAWKSSDNRFLFERSL